MTRLKGILKILSVVLAVLLLAVGFAGCGEYKPPTSTGGNSPVTPPIVDPVPDDNSFTVSLVFRDVIQLKDESGKLTGEEEQVETPFTSADYSLITRLQAQWTEITDGRPAVYRASFDNNGVARIKELDGDFNVTLVLTSDFNSKYCYDPNLGYDPNHPDDYNELVTTKYKKSVTVPIYQLKKLGKKNNMTLSDGTFDGKKISYYTLTSTGAYSYTLQNSEEKQFFMFSPKKSGEYSFLTLMDVTADEINPWVDLHTGNSQFISAYPAVQQNDGGAEGNYTKNVVLKYQIAKDEVGNVMIFNLYSESEKSYSYPHTIYFIFERDGEFTRPVSESTPVPITEDFGKTPPKPAGTLEWVGESSLFGNTPDMPSKRGVHILNQKSVKYNDPKSGGDGYYYYIDSATGDFFREADGSVSAQYRIYAVLSAPLPVLANGEEAAGLNHVLLAKGYYWVEGEDGTVKNYYNFIMGTNGYAYYSLFNPDGAYPVNAELKQFLQDFAISQRYFNDGNGFAEDIRGAAYNSDEDSQWLFACGIYV